MRKMKQGRHQHGEQDDGNGKPFAHDWINPRRERRSLLLRKYNGLARHDNRCAMQKQVNIGFDVDCHAEVLRSIWPIRASKPRACTYLRMTRSVKRVPATRLQS